MISMEASGGFQSSYLVLKWRQLQASPTLGTSQPRNISKYSNFIVWFFEMGIKMRRRGDEKKKTKKNAVTCLINCGTSLEKSQPPL